MVKLNIIKRLGNKKDDIKYFEHHLPKNIKYVVEPFGCSFAVSKYVYQDLDKYIIHINDNDPVLYHIYKNYKQSIDLVKKLDELYNDKYQNKSKEFKNYVENLDINDYLKQYIINTKFIRGHIYKPVKSQSYNEIEENILKHAIITHEDYKSVMKKCKYKKNAFIFVDPPYLFSDNSGYVAQSEDNDMTDIIVYLLDYLKTCKCKVMIIINSLKILAELFKDYIKGEYTKIYGISNKTNVHLILTNY
jgi:site-specific DNA-adenine methylase